MKIINFKKKEEIDDLSEFNYGIEDLYQEPKGMKIFYNAAFGFSFSMFGAALLASFGVPFGIGCLICLPTLGPSSIVGLNILKKKADRDLAADMQGFQQIIKMFLEENEKDHKIEKGTSYFYQEIDSKKELQDLSSSATNNINQFLYMINENYYEDIASKHSLRREEVVDKILDQIVFYASNYGLYDFNADKAQEIIKGCFFIDDNLKKAIVKEFKRSEYVFNGHKNYRILSKNIDANKDADLCIAELYELKKSKSHCKKTFDVEDIEWYDFLLSCMSEIETDYGSPYNVEWDLESVRDIMSFMLTKYHSKFTDIKGEYYNADVVISFLYSSFIYATLNNTGKVGINEIIQTFKAWSFFDNLFDLKLEVLDAIFERFNLDYSMHPFREAKSTKKENKVLSFPKVGK